MTPDVAMYDLVIVGMGPVGATAAALAGRRGMSVLALDRSVDVFPHPRAIVLDHEVMRTWQGIGLVDGIQEHLRPYRPTEYRGAAGTVIKRFDSRSPPYMLGWAPNYAFSQPPVERALRRVVQKMESVRIETGADVRALEQAPDSVRVTYRTEEGSDRIANGRYILACDGGGSTIRAGLSMQFESLDFDESWLVVDGIIAKDSVNALPDVNVQYCEPERPCTYVVGPGNHRRWEFMLRDEETAATAAQPAFIHTLLSRWIAPDSISLWRSAAYRFHALVLSKWRKNRVFFVGDSAHMTPPFLAQGMCQGIRDAANLIWKLHYVIAGRATDTILDTYEQERSPHVRHTTELAKSLGRLICERDPQRALERDQRLLSEHDGVVPVTIRQDLLPGLEGGLTDNAHAGSATVSGSVCPQPVVESSDGRSALLDDIFGVDLRLIVREAPDLRKMVESGVLREILPGLDVVMIGQEHPRPSVAACPVRDVDGVLTDWMGARHARVLLVRPDHYIFGGDNMPEGAIALCERFKQRISSGAVAYAI